MILAKRLALVTGGGQGNGAAVAKGLAAHGARVIVTDINLEGATATAQAIKTTGAEAWAFKHDVTDVQQCDDLAAQIEREIGDLDVLVNNAGICPRNSIDSPDVRKTWELAMNINLNGTLNVTLSFLAALRRTKGSIVNIASIASFVSTSTSISYSTSKAAVKMLSQNLAQELARDGVRVNSIAPGTFATPMTEVTRSDPQRRDKFISRIPMGRFGEPEEMVGPVVFLASSMSSYVTGSTVVVDGGYLAV
ncbi:MAG: glucose 1-dehydrogenase [Mesorhizobium sp.]|nr:MAG: glucose 1-dehydrogenase [Mesorhizobium sp.]